MVSGSNNTSSLQSTDVTQNSIEQSGGAPTFPDSKSFLHSLCALEDRRTAENPKHDPLQELNKPAHTSLLSASSAILSASKHLSPPRPNLLPSHILNSPRLPKPAILNSGSSEESHSLSTKPSFASQTHFVPPVSSTDASSNALSATLNQLPVAERFPASDRGRSVMDMHEEGSNMLQQFGVNGDSDVAVTQQRTDSHVMSTHEHVQQTSAAAPNVTQMHHSTALSHPPMTTTAQHVSAGLPNRSSPIVSPGNELAAPLPKVHNPNEEQQREPAQDQRSASAHLAASGHMVGLPPSTQAAPHGVQQGDQTISVSRAAPTESIPQDQMHRNHQNTRIDKPAHVMGATEGQPHVEGSQPTGAVMNEREQADRGSTNQGMHDNALPGEEQGQTGVESNIAGVVGAGVVEHGAPRQVQPGQGQNVEVKSEVPSSMPVDEEMKKEGILLQTNATGVVLNNVAARMSIGGTTPKKANRMPGTKQCPTCQNTIAAAVAKCPKCPHVFREKKEKVKRSGKRGKKNCPKCSYENPSACSSCKQCKHVFRLKLMDKYKAMRPSRTVNESAAVAAAAAAHAAASLHAQQGAVGPVAPVSVPAGVPSYPNHLGAMHAAAHGMPVMPPMAPHTMTLPPHSHSLHAASMAQMHQQIPQHPMQPHQPHPQL